MFQKIKSDISKILAENLVLKKEVVMLRSLLEFSDIQIAALKKTVHNVATSLQKCEKEFKEQYSLIKIYWKFWIGDLELSQDALEK